MKHLVRTESCTHSSPEMQPQDALATFAIPRRSNQVSKILRLGASPGFCRAIDRGILNMATAVLVTGLILVAQAAAHSEVMLPSGFVTLDVVGGDPVDPPTLAIGTGLLRSAAFQGKILSASDTGGVTQLTFAANSFAVGTYDPASGNPTHGIEIVGGNLNGALANVVVTGDSSVTLDRLLTPTELVDFSARIRPFWTFNLLFGSDNAAGFASGPTSVADVFFIRLPDGTTKEIRHNGTQWVDPSDAASGDVPIPSEAGIELIRRGTDDLAIKIFGDVKPEPTAVTLNSGLGSVTYFQTLHPLDSPRLKDLGLYTGDPATGVKPGNTPAEADVLTIGDPATGETYDFYVDTDTGRWTTGSTDASLVQIPANSTVKLTRRHTSGLGLNVPPPPMALGEDPLELELVAAASRKVHGSPGRSFDVNLPIGDIAVEPREGTDLTVVFSFDGASSENPLVSGTAQLTNAIAGIVDSTDFVGNEFRVNLSGVTDIQTLTLEISNVAALNAETFSGPASVNIGQLLGDVSNNQVINVGDTLFVKQSENLPVNFSNFRADIDANGTVSTSNLDTVRNRSGLGL